MVLQLNCRGCAFVCEKKWKCWRPKCFLYPRNSKRYKLPRPVLPRCPRPASPCRPLALFSLGPFQWTLSPEPSILALHSRNTMFCTVDLSWAAALKVACSHHRLTAFGEASVSFPMVLRFMTYPLDGHADLPVASVKPIEGEGLVPPSMLSWTLLE